MGNRAVIALNGYSDDTKGIYLHWNGGRSSIMAFLEFAKRDQPWIKESGVDKLISGIHCFGVSAHKVELARCGELDCDNRDNGVYIVDTASFEIIGRVFDRNEEQMNYTLDPFVEHIEEMYATKMGITGVERYVRSI